MRILNVTHKESQPDEKEFKVEFNADGENIQFSKFDERVIVFEDEDGDTLRFWAKDLPNIIKSLHLIQRAIDGEQI